MDELNNLGEASASSEIATVRRRRSFALRTGATVVVACGLAAGSYGIAAAASNSSTPKQASTLAATSTTTTSPAKTSPSPTAPRLAGPRGFGSLAWGRGSLGFGGPGGTVKSFTPTTITINTAFGGAVTVTTNSSTKYSESGTTVSRSALAVGDEIVFSPFSRPGSKATAGSPISPIVSSVDIVPPQVSGKVVSVSASQIVVQQSDQLYVKVNVSASTSYEQAGQTASSKALVVGAEVSVTGTVSSDHFQIDATTIDVLLPSVIGQVTAVSGTSITITSPGGTTETITTDSSTLFRNRSGKTTIASVAKGDTVEAYGTQGSDKSFSAVTVDVLPVSAPGQELPGGPSAPFGRGRFGGPRDHGAPSAGFGGQAPWAGQGGGATTGIAGTATNL